MISQLSDNISVWAQCGRARFYNYYATDEEMLQVIRNAVSDDLRPCSLIYLTLEEKENGKFVQVMSTYDINDPVSLNASGDLFIWSKAYLPSLLLTNFGEIELALVHIGLVRYTLPYWQTNRLTGRKVLTDSCITLIDHVINTETGEERRYPMMLKLYHKLKRELNKLLVYSTIWTNPETGVQYESDRLKMSEGVYQRIVTGTQEYNVLPGRRLT